MPETGTALAREALCSLAARPPSDRLHVNFYVNLGRQNGLAENEIREVLGFCGG